MKKSRMIGSTCPIVFTFDPYLSLGLDVSQFGHGDASVRGRLADVSQHEDVLSEGNVLLRGQLHCPQSPTDRRHRRPNCHACQIDRSTRHHFCTLWRNGKVRRHATHCSQTKKQLSVHLHFIYSFIHSFIPELTCLFVHLVISHSFIHLFVHSFLHHLFSSSSRAAKE